MAKRPLPLVTGDTTKTMLPEVLPDPRAGRAREGGPRARTLAHMQRLVATAASMGVATGVAGCGKETKRRDPDPVPQPVASETATVPPVLTAEPPPTVNPIPPTGYAVVDPVPRPAHCPDVAAAMTSKATFGKNGALTLEVHGPARPDFRWVRDAKPVVYGGSVKSFSFSNADAVVEIAPTGGVQVASVSLRAFCSKGPITIAASISWSGEPKAGVEPSASLNEY